MSGDGWQDSDLLRNPYAQGRVVLKVVFDEDTKKRWNTDEDRQRSAIFGGSNKTGVFDIYEYEPLFEIEDNFKNEEQFTKVLPVVNGWWSPELAAAEKYGDEKWLANLMTSKARYVGHPTKKWDSRVTKNWQSMGCQVQGIRQFFAVEDSPLNSIMTMRVMTISQAQEYIKNSPYKAIPGRVPCVVVPLDIKDIATDFKAVNTVFMTNSEEFEREYNIKYERTTKVVAAIKSFHRFALLCGISFLSALVRDNVIELKIPDNPDIRPTTDAENAILSKSEANNWLLALTSKMDLLPNTTYPTIERNNRSPDAKHTICDWSRLALKTMMPNDDSRFFFGWDRETGKNPLGFDSSNKCIKTGTAHGDMINAIYNSQTDFLIGVSDWIYYETRNVVGRVITPARKWNYGSLI